jgi:hypothetical protein
MMSILPPIIEPGNLGILLVKLNYILRYILIYIPDAIMSRRRARDNAHSGVPSLESLYCMITPSPDPFEIIQVLSCHRIFTYMSWMISQRAAT